MAIGVMRVAGLRSIRGDWLKGISCWRRLTSIKVGAQREGKSWRKTWGQPHLQEKVHDYVIEHSNVEKVVRDLREASMKLSSYSMAATIDQLPILSMFVNMIRAKLVVEIGTFTGISALQFALTLPDDGQVITIDKSDENLDMAKRFWSRAGVSHKIEPRLGSGLRVLDDLLHQGYSDKVDLAFVDADKLGYDDYYEKLLTLVRLDGVILFDNVLWYGRVADEQTDDKITNSFRTLNKKLLHDNRVQFTLIPASDGLAVCQVKKKP